MSESDVTIAGEITKVKILNDEDDDYKISRTYGNYVLDATLEKEGDDVFFNTVICATPAVVYVFYRMEELPKNFIEILHQNNVYSVMDNVSFDSITKIYKISGETITKLNNSELLTQKQKDEIGISEDQLESEATTQAQVLEEKKFTRAFQASHILHREKLAKDKLDEKRWDQDKMKSRENKEESPSISEERPQQPKRVEEPVGVPTLKDIAKYDLHSGVAAQDIDYSLTCLVLKMHNYGVKETCQIEKNGIKWFVVECDASSIPDLPSNIYVIK